MSLWASLFIYKHIANVDGGSTWHPLCCSLVLLGMFRWWVKHKSLDLLIKVTGWAELNKLSWPLVKWCANGLTVWRSYYGPFHNQLCHNSKNLLWPGLFVLLLIIFYSVYLLRWNGAVFFQYFVKEQCFRNEQGLRLMHTSISLSMIISCYKPWKLLLANSSVRPLAVLPVYYLKQRVHRRVVYFVLKFPFRVDAMTTSLWSFDFAWSKGHSSNKLVDAWFSRWIPFPKLSMNATSP